MKTKDPLTSLIKGPLVTRVMNIIVIIITTVYYYWFL